MGRPPQGPVAVASSTSHIQGQPVYRSSILGNYPEGQYSSTSSPSLIPINSNITSTSLSPEAMIENLSLGGQFSCSCLAGTKCNCSSSSRRKSHSPSSLASNNSSSNSIYFWKRTLRNPISKRPFKPRGCILTPPKLKLLLNSQTVGETGSCSSTSSMMASSSSPSPLRLLQHQRQDSSDVFIPDLSRLSLGNSMNSDLDLRLQQSLQAATPTTSLCYPRRFRNLKWKTRIMCSLSTTSCPSLPTIREDKEDGDEEGNDTGSSQTGIRNVQNQQIQSQGGRTPGDHLPGPVVDDVTIDELASYLENGVYIPKKMSPQAEMMYT